MTCEAGTGDATGGEAGGAREAAGGDEAGNMPGDALGKPGKPYYLYVVECADGTWYTGYTDDVPRRIATHNAGRGAKYTRSRRPVRLVAQAEFATRHEAMSAEYRFKRRGRDEKERLVTAAARAGEPLAVVLERELGVARS